MFYSIFHYFILFYFLKEHLIIQLCTVFLNMFSKDSEPEDGPNYVKTCCSIRQTLCLIKIVVLRMIMILLIQVRQSSEI